MTSKFSSFTSYFINQFIEKIFEKESVTIFQSIKYENILIYNINQKYILSILCDINFLIFSIYRDRNKISDNSFEHLGYCPDKTILFYDINVDNIVQKIIDEIILIDNNLHDITNTFAV